jgi:recombination protein RecR
MSDPIDDLIGLLARLPGVGERTAARLAYFILGSDRQYAHSLGKAVAEIHDRVKRCDQCRNYTGSELCSICSDPRRDPALICVVARPPDVAAIERGALFRGRYHVLHGLLSPLDGMGPEKLPLQPLLDRIARDAVREVIIATPLSVDGEATALYIAEQLRPLGVRCSRIASGLPHGSELEYADQITLSRALEGRRDL